MKTLTVTEMINSNDYMSHVVSTECQTVQDFIETFDGFYFEQVDGVNVADFEENILTVETTDIENTMLVTVFNNSEISNILYQSCFPVSVDHVYFYNLILNKLN